MLSLQQKKLLMAALIAYKKDILQDWADPTVFSLVFLLFRYFNFEVCYSQIS